MGNQNMNQEITCPQCSYKFALDQALNREIELQMRTQLSDEFKKKEAELRQQLTKEAAERADRNSAELQIKFEAQGRELKQARDNERALLRTKVELQEQAEKAELEALRHDGICPQIPTREWTHAEVERAASDAPNALTLSPSRALRKRALLQSSARFSFSCHTMAWYH
jgi:hypothetical protein